MVRRQVWQTSCAVAVVVAFALCLAPSQAFAQERKPSSDPVFVPLYTAFAALQGMDMHSTMRALDAGRREANPIMGGLADNPSAFLAVKAGTTAGTIFLVEKMRKRSRTGAIVLMAALNSAYVAVVAHNYRAGR